MSEEHGAGEALLRTGVIVPVRIVEEAVVSGADEGEFALHLNLSFDDKDSPEEDRDEVVEWGALGFLFAIGVLSFVAVGRAIPPISFARWMPRMKHYAGRPLTRVGRRPQFS